MTKKEDLLKELGWTPELIKHFISEEKIDNTIDYDVIKRNKRPREFTATTININHIDSQIDFSLIK